MQRRGPGPRPTVSEYPLKDTDPSARGPRPAAAAPALSAPDAVDLQPGVRHCGDLREGPDPRGRPACAAPARDHHHELSSVGSGRLARDAARGSRWSAVRRAGRPLGSRRCCYGQADHLVDRARPAGPAGRSAGSRCSGLPGPRSGSCAGTRPCARPSWSPAAPGRPARAGGRRAPGGAGPDLLVDPAGDHRPPGLVDRLVVPAGDPQLVLLAGAGRAGQRRPPSPSK